MNKPIAVIISDVHYNLHTLKLADTAMRMAIAKANELAVPLVVAGDLHDTKANLRGECINAMIETFSLLRLKALVIVGNHDKINEKSEAHSLNFLEPHVNFIVNKPQKFCIETDENLDTDLGYIIPYQHDHEILKFYLKTLPKGSTVIMHQGISGSNSGDYIQDKSAITPQDVAGLNVISGHYHTRQTIKLPNNGTWNYIGNPFTLNYGEANDPPKGFQILMSDGSLEFVPTDLRKHIVFEFDAKFSALGPAACPVVCKDDLLWIKAKGTREELAKLNKKSVAVYAGLDPEFTFRFDSIPSDTKSQLPNKTLTRGILIDSIISNLNNTSDDRKDRLKKLWKSL